MNLSEKQTRQVEQQEKIGRRASIIDDRRNTRAPVLETNANLRNSRRGDGGAAALMRTLGVVQDGAEDLSNYATNQEIQNERENVAQGALDVQAGTVDEELLGRSNGYRNAVTRGRTVNAFAEASQEFEEELSAVIEAQDSPDLEERRAEIEQMLEGFYTNFAADPETGELREFLQSPGAMRYLATAISDQRPAALANSLERVEQRFNREALSHYSSYISREAVTNGTVDIEQALTLLPDTVTDEERAETTFQALQNASEALRAEGRFEEAVSLLAALRGRFDTPMGEEREQAATEGGIETIDLPPSSVAMPDPEALRMPVQGRVTSEFGAGRGSSTHNGVDIAVPVGTPVNAAMGGEVLRVWNSDRGGISMRVQYDDGTVVGFAHLSETNFREGQRVEAGDTMVLTGNTGRSTGPHLHYTMRQNGQYVDPLQASVGELSGAPEGTERQQLRDPNEDPITRLEREGGMTPVNGLDQIVFTPQQQARADQLYRQQTDVIRREWQAHEADRYSDNASNLALGLFGIGGQVTSLQDIQTAFAEDDIDGEAVMTLVRLHESQIERREARAERAENRRERQERRQRERAVADSSMLIIGQVISGEITAAEARADALTIATGGQDPETGYGVVSEVLRFTNTWESAVENSEPVQRRLREFSEFSEGIESYVAGMEGIPTHRRTAAVEAMGEIVTRAQGRYARNISGGMDPEEAGEDVERWISQQEAAMLEGLRPTTPQY